jgi:hypothetical protein
VVCDFTIRCFYIGFVSYIYVGSGSAEGFHSRLDKIIPRRVFALDDMVEFLAQEDEFWNRRVHNPRLWAEKKNQFKTSRERHYEKRRRLSYYYERKNRTDRSSQSLILSDICEDISDLFISDEETKTKDNKDDGILSLLLLFYLLIPITDDAIDLVSESITTSTTSTWSQPPRAGINKPNKSNLDSLDNHLTNPAPKHKKRTSIAPERVCPKCNQRKFNGDCSLHVCKPCCVASTERCSLPDHKRAKVGARKPYNRTTTATASQESATIDAGILEKINSAIAGKHSVWISYQDNNLPRKIIPHRFKEGSEGRLVETTHIVINFATKKEFNQSRSFFLHKITRTEDHDWTEPPVNQQSIFPEY